MVRHAALSLISDKHTERNIPHPTTTPTPCTNNRDHSQAQHLYCTNKCDHGQVQHLSCACVSTRETTAASATNVSTPKALRETIALSHMTSHHSLPAHRHSQRSHHSHHFCLCRARAQPRAPLYEVDKILDTRKQKGQVRTPPALRWWWWWWWWWWCLWG
jgi:hypothetical protein